MKRRRPLSYERRDIDEREREAEGEEARAVEALRNQLGYGEGNNPFNDTRVSKPFVWRKRATGDDGNTRASRPSSSDRALLEEILQVRQRREERELNDKQRGELRCRASQERETQNYDEWQRIEDRFHREVSKLRAKLHIERGREDLFHYLLKTFELGNDPHQPETAENVPSSDGTEALKSPTKDNMSYEFSNKDISNQPPSQVIAESSNDQLKTLDEDVRSRLLLNLKEKEDLSQEEDVTQLDMDETEREFAIERLTASVRFWRMTLRLVRWEQQRREETASSRKGVPAFVEKQLSALLGSKRVEELDELKKSVELQLSSGSSDVDVDFWENVRLRIPLYKALTRVDTIWRRAIQRDDVQQVDVLQSIAKKNSGLQPKDAEDTDIDGWAPPLGVSIVEDGISKALPIQFTEGEPYTWEGQAIAPEFLVSADEADDSRDGLDNLEDCEKWQDQQNLTVKGVDDLDEEETFNPRFAVNPVGIGGGGRVRKTLDVGMEGESDDPAAVFDRFVAREKALNAEDEMVLEGQEVDVSSQGPITSKYQLRKPRYFNRVRTGFEWNRYNQAHYDQDNPPPRTVQGYKFTIGYPHLLDPARTPTWRLYPSENEDDGTVILRFHGGPPYEDVAFRIVKREWDFNPRRGYRNCFERGVLLLHFNFKRLRYRK